MQIKRRVTTRMCSQRRRALGCSLLVLWVAGCGGTSKSSTPAPPVTTVVGPQMYFAPQVAAVTDLTNSLGDVIATGDLSTFTIDDKGDTFSQTSYQLDPPQQQGPQTLNSGVVASSSRGLLSLGVTANYAIEGNLYVPLTFDPPQAGSFAIELAGRTGGLVQMVNQPAQPLVAATQCPSLTKAQTYLFLTIPAALAPTQTPIPAGTWDPTSETAYGTVDISSNGSAISFQNIHQFTLPSIGGNGAPSTSPPASATGACGSTFYGDTISVPGQLVITNPGNGQTVSYQANIGIGASGGLLVEDNNNSGAPLTGTPYENVLGAGTGAVGLPLPSSAVDPGSTVGAQYLGFIYAAGVYPGNSSSPTGWSSHLVSFGFASVPLSCASVAPSTATIMYGGEFPGDDPTSSPDGYGNCDFAIDLGAQSSSTNGLFANATVWVGANYPGNTSGSTYSFSAVAISGQIGGKDAVFVLGVDASQPWEIDLLQSN